MTPGAAAAPWGRGGRVHRDDPEAFGEIEITRTLVNAHPGPGEMTADEVTGPLAEMAARGVRVVLVTIDTCGGRAGAAFTAYNALRSFSEAGGTVITYVAGQAGSSGALLALAGDLILFGPEGVYRVHGAVDGTPERRAEIDAAQLAIMAARTSTPRADLERWLSCRDNAEGRPVFAELRASAVSALGWADLPVQGIEEARQVAREVAEGLRPVPPRPAPAVTRWPVREILSVRVQSA